MEKENCCKTKNRNEEVYRDLTHRLNRIEGQVRGIKNMVEEDRYCVDILNQVSAIQAALGSFSQKLLSDHIRTCVVDGVKAGDESKVDELCDTMKKFIK